MKKTMFYLLFTGLLFISFELKAQDWTIGGNTLIGDGKFGSKNNHDVLFITNNIQRGLMTADGRWAFGIAVPNARVEINGIPGLDPLRVLVSGVTKLYVHNGGGVAVGNGFLPPPINGLYVFGNTGFGISTPNGKVHINSASGQDALRVDVNGLTKFLVHNAGGVSVGTVATPPVNGLYVSGNAAIGTTTPSTKLHVNSLSSSFIKQSPLRADVGGVARLFAHYNGGLSVGSGLTPPDSGLYVSGRVGIGLNTPSFQLQLSTNSAAKPGSQFWTVASDQRLKKDIADFTDGMNIISKIHPVWYNYNGDAGLPTKERSVGTLAQELQKVAPYMIKNWSYHKDEKSAKTDYLSVDYNALLFMFVNAFKEQEQKISMQEERLANMEAILTAIVKDKNIRTTDLASSIPLLEQNQPNPFNQTTTIRYRIPRGTNAQLVISDGAGKQVKKMQANESGQVQLTAYELNSGIYTYALIVNGNEVTSKKMLIIK